MNKWIDAEWLCNELGDINMDIYTDEVKEYIEQAPSIDVVRCRECVKANTEDCSHSYWDDYWGEWRVDYKGDDWFCADGERNSSEKPNNSERSSE